MANFSYRAINESGLTVTGIVEADSVDMANNMLLGRGYIPTKVVTEKQAGGGGWLSSVTLGLGRVKTSDLILFTKQFRSMLRSGVPILRLLQVLEVQTQSQALRSVISSMSQEIKQGSTLFEAMEKHPGAFSPLYRSMIRAGEASGNVPDVLERLIYIIEHDARIRADIKSALQYPIMVVVALVIAFFVLLTLVIPKFIMIFSKAGLTLPLPTRVAVVLYKALTDYWYLLLLGVAGIIVGLRYYFSTEQGRFVRDKFLLGLPILGSLFTKAAMARFASIFSILQASGVPVLNALTILSGTIGNTAISRAFDLVKERVQEGQGISAPLKTTKYFTPMVVDMIAIGEESGNIEEMLREITVHYDDEVGYAVKRLSEALGPILLVGLAGVVGFFALAIFLPMWDLTKMVTPK
jgi:type II secretory pathway component PulF